MVRKMSPPWKATSKIRQTFGWVTFRRELNLAPEPFDRQVVAGDVPAHGLERDPLAQLLVLDLVDLAHAAAGQEAHDAVALGDFLPWSERGLAVGARGCRLRRSD